MQSRPIPKTGEALPVIGLGTWQTFDVGSGKAAHTERATVLQTLFDGGASMIDSSPMYGRAEGVVGDLLAEPAVTCVIPGTANPSHLVDNLAAGSDPLPDARARAALIRAAGAG